MVRIMRWAGIAVAVFVAVSLFGGTVHVAAPSAGADIGPWSAYGGNAPCL